MGGTFIGGRRAAQTNKIKYGHDFYARIGSLGGQKGTTGGFAYWKAIGREDLISQAGAKGGRISKRGSKKRTFMDIIKGKK